MFKMDISRNHRLRPGDDFKDIVNLAGWEQQSIWGYDEGLGSFYAQLWQNGSKSDAPDIWLSGADVCYPWPGCIALEIVMRIRRDPLDVVGSLGIAGRKPRLRRTEEITNAVREIGTSVHENRYLYGQVHALAWILGNVDSTPGGRKYWDGRKPSAAQVEAEHQLVTGRIYRFEDRETFAGADTALWWALRGTETLL